MKQATKTNSALCRYTGLGSFTEFFSKHRVVSLAVACFCVSSFSIFAQQPLGADAVAGSQVATERHGSIFGSIPTPALFCTTNNEKEWVTVSGFCHLLMFYGLKETDLPDFPSGKSLLNALTDEQNAIKVFGKSPFVQTRNGLRYYLSNDPIFQTDVGEAHRDQCLATFAELNLPLDTPFQLKSQRYSLRELLAEAVANFDFREKEPAWTAVAFANYLPPNKEWVNRFRERTTFSQLAQHLLEVDPNTQSCAGSHVFEALGLIAKADRNNLILDKNTREQLHGYLAKTLHEIVERQQSDGGWNQRWCSAINQDETGQMTELEMRVLVTGHLVGILREIDFSHEIPETAYERAADWLQNSLKSTEIHTSASWLCPVTHAAVSVRAVKARITADELVVKVSTPRVTALESAFADRSFHA